MSDPNTDRQGFDPAAPPNWGSAFGSVLDPTLAGLFEFIWNSPSPYHAVEQTLAMLAGVELSGSSADGGTVIASLAAPEVDPALLSFRIVGAHTDSPNLRVKPQPDSGRAGYRQLVVEPYGGVLLNSWLDRDLGLSGRVAVREGGSGGGSGGSASGSASGEISTRLLHVNRPLLRVPQLAIHLDREVTQAGLKLTSQHLTPVWGLGDAANSASAASPPESAGRFAAFLAHELDCDPAAICSWELMTHDLTPPAALGIDGEFYAAPRIDNLASCFSATQALAQLPATDLTDNTVAVIALYDHEEVGSASSSGASSPTLQHFLERTALSLGANRDQFLAALQRSVCVSADGAHAVHPNYLDRHDANHHVHLNGGPVIKLNPNQRYATNAKTSAIFQAACAAAGVGFQQYSHHTDLPCGSTIGPLTATQLGIDVVDVGSAQLSMHSARELGGAKDPAMLTAALREFLRG